MPIETSWLDLLKANGWHLAGLTLACGAALLADRNEWIALDPSFRQATTLSLFVCCGLWLASVGQAATKSLSGLTMILRRKLAERSDAKRFHEYIPYMTPEEKAVIAQLLHENRKSFDGASDGGFAAPLIGRGFIQTNLAPHQSFTYENVPWLIPDHIWDVAVQNREAFNHVPDLRGGDAWRVPWMAK